MKSFVVFLLSFSLFAGTVMADTTKEVSKSGIQSLAVGAYAGAATAVADVVTGGEFWLATWFLENALRCNIVGSVSNEDNKDGRMEQALGSAASWATYFLTYSKFSRLANPDAARLDKSLYLGVVLLKILVPLLRT